MCIRDSTEDSDSESQGQRLFRGPITTIKTSSRVKHIQSGYRRVSKIVICSR